MLQTVQTVGQLDHLIGVPGEVTAEVYTPVAVFYHGTIEVEFNTLVAEFTHVHPDGGTTGAHRSGGLQDLVHNALVVVSEVEAQAVLEELTFQTYFHFVGGFRTEGVVVQAGVDDIVGIGVRLVDGLLGVNHSGLVHSGSITYDTIGSTELEEINSGGHVEQFGHNEGSVHGRIPVRVVTHSQGGNRLITDGTFDECPVLIGEGDRTENSLLEEFGLGHTGVGLVAGSVQVEPILHGEATVSAYGRIESSLGTGGITGNYIQAELLGELAAEGSHHITVDGGVGVVGEAIVTGVTQGQRTVVGFLVLNALSGIVRSDVGLQGEALDDFPAGGYAGDEALVVFQLLPSQDAPQIVTGDIAERKTVSPAYGRFRLLVVGIYAVAVTVGGNSVLTDVLDVVEGTEHTGEVVGQTGDTVRTVLHVLIHIVDGVTEFHGTVGGDVLATVQGEVVLADVGVVLVGQVVEEGVCETHIALVGTGRDGHIVLLGETGAEQVGPRVVGDGVVSAHLAIKVVNLTTVVLGTEVHIGSIYAQNVVAVHILTHEEAFVGVALAGPLVVTSAGTEDGLVLGHISHKVSLDGGTELYVHAAVALTLFHGDEHNTVSTFGTVEGSSGSALQDGEVLDIFNVDIGQTVTLNTLHGPVVTVVGISVADRNAVHDDEGLVGTGDGGNTTNLDGDSTGSTTGSRADTDTGSLTIEGRTQGRSHGGVQALGRNGGNCITHLLLILADTEGGHHSAFQHFCIFLEHYVNYAAIPGDGLAGITDAGDLQLVALMDAGEGKGTVQIGDSTVVGSGYLHSCSDDSFTGSIFHSTFDRGLGEGRHAACEQCQSHGHS